MGEHFATTWEALADAFPDQAALVHGTQTVCWREFDERSSRLAEAMTAAGVRPGDTVGIDLYNCNEYLETFFAALKIRAVPANINYRYLDDELRQLLVQSEAKVLVHHASLAKRVQSAIKALPWLALVVEVNDLQTPRSPAGGTHDYESLIASHPPAPRIDRPGSDVFLSFTGGTTGLPKGVEHVIESNISNTAVLSRLMLGLEGLD